MSYQQPSSFGGSPNYTQQWASSHPAMFPQTFAPNTEYATLDQPAPSNSGPIFDLNDGSGHANSHIPGLQSHSTSGAYFPPSFPLPQSGSHPTSMPSGTSDARFGLSNQHRDVAPHLAKWPETGMRAISDPNREEGEISDQDGEGSTPHKNDAQSFTRGGPTLGRDPTSDLEEGETSSSGAPASSRKSGSPYNPPLFITADENVIDRKESQKPQASNTDSKKFSLPLKSLAQLRIQAQGALLSLAPHNIRYHELVAEGIDPAILRQLYEDVGIKVATQPDRAPTTSGVATKMSGVTQANQTPVPGTNSILLPNGRAEPMAPVKENVAAKKSVLTATRLVSTPAPSASQTDTSKPLERKDVIARMLAAKAAKASGSMESESRLPKHTASPRSLNAAPATSSSEARSKENEAPVREKNKAQTELARQRIEQLKQQALLKSQQKTQEASLPHVDAGHNAGTIGLSVHPDHSPHVIHHQLPVRPPAPESIQSARIPGLVMAGSNQEVEREVQLFPGQAVPIESTPVPRAAQRKRPRASDFDEPVIAPKRHLGQEKPHGGAADRLVIDISDDESLYGDDEGDHMDMDSSRELDPRPVAAPEAAEPSIRNPLPAITRTSTSTPQALSRNSDQQHIRQKDLEIQALHRKIAEAERRRKAKLASSRTQSPRAFEDSGSSMSAGQSSASAADIEATDGSAAQTPVSKMASATKISPAGLADRPNLIDCFSDSSVRVLASMDMAQLDSIRSKILRLREIESGLPDLDAEILSSESRLSVCRQEAERLLAEIAKGKEGRLQLIEELKRLSDEINGLSLEDLDELRRQAEVKEQYLAAKEAAASTLQSADDAHDSVFTYAETGSLTHLQDPPETAQFSSSNPRTTNEAEETPRDSSLPSTSDSAGSIMDESAGSASARSEPSEDEELAAPDSGPDLDSHHPPVPATTDTVGPKDLQHPLPERPPSAATHPSKDISGESDISYHQDEDRATQESSAASETYEPPEPEADAQSGGSAYSPPFSPAPPDPVENMAASTPSSDLSQADEALTDDPQVSVSNRPPDSQAGVVDSEVPTADSTQRFTPYISPLRYFKAYRYHPRYAEDVSNDYRSLTYSHNIDPMKYLCPYEAAGGVCNDRSCEFQHFRDMTLSDDKILVQMGAVREGNTEEEKEAYLAGLKEIINEMRRDKVKDFSTLANEIAAYRRRFLQDPSRVLPL